MLLVVYAWWVCYEPSGGCYAYLADWTTHLQKYKQFPYVLLFKLLVAHNFMFTGSLPAISPTTTQPSSMLTTSAPPLLIQPQTTGSSTPSKLKQGKISTKKGKNSPTLRKSQFVLVASEAIPLTGEQGGGLPYMHNGCYPIAAEDMQGVIGVDERTITRVNTNPTKAPGSDSSDAPNPSWSAEELDHNALGTSRWSQKIKSIAFLVIYGVISFIHYIYFYSFCMYNNDKSQCSSTFICTIPHLLFLEIIVIMYTCTVQCVGINYYT